MKKAPLIILGLVLLCGAIAMFTLKMPSSQSPGIGAEIAPKQIIAPIAADGPIVLEKGSPAIPPLDFPDDMERSIKLPVIEQTLPPGPGKGNLAALCTTCHTLRYITMQPSFSRKVWDAEVHKMKNVFGAPLNDQQMEQVVDYLVAVKGVNDAAHY